METMIVEDALRKNAVVITSSVTVQPGTIDAGGVLPVSTSVSVKGIQQPDIATTTTSSASTSVVKLGPLTIQISTSVDASTATVWTTTTLEATTRDLGTLIDCNASNSDSDHETLALSEVEPQVTVRLWFKGDNANMSKIVKIQGSQEEGVALGEIHNAADKTFSISWGYYMVCYDTHDIRPGDLSTCVPKYAKVLRYGDTLFADTEVYLKRCQCQNRCDGVYYYKRHDWS